MFLLVGTVVFLGIIGVATLPKVSIAKVRGVTSRRSTSLTSPVNTPPWIAAPIATTSSGLTPFDGFLPKNFSKKIHLWIRKAFGSASVLNFTGSSRPWYTIWTTGFDSLSERK